MKDLLNKTFTETATFNEKNGGYYQHFGIHPVTASLYGDKVEDIKTISFKIAKDQTLPDSNNKDMTPDYWGWYDYEDNEFSNMIYAQRFLLDMCFPYGIPATENAGKGKAYRLEIL